MVLGDTIAAIATARGRGGIAVVRVSGPDAFEIAAKVAGVEVSGRGVHVARFRDCSDREKKTIDMGVALSFPGPNSYTGEDVVEFQCHGGEVTPARVLLSSIAAGARIATRGEFTRRALLNGKLGYGEAEAVLDLIDAKTAKAADAALDRLSGRSRRRCAELYSRALEISARLEHILDVDEGEIPKAYIDSLDGSIQDLLSRIGKAIRSVREGRILRTGALVVLSGPPNAGKSSLMNALLETDRAIVSDIPGTTRDSIEEWMDIGGWPVRLVDTAGIRETADGLEAEGVRRSIDLSRRADIVLRLSEDADFPALAGNEIAVATKCDLGADRRASGAVYVSALSGEGLSSLKDAIAEKLSAMASSGELDGGEESDVDGAGLTQVLHALESALSGPLAREKDPVLMANAVRSAAVKLGELLGEVYSEDILERLFERFCVGK